MDPSLVDVEQLSHRVATDGVAAHWRDVAAVVHLAARAGAPAAVLAAVADPHAAEVVRQRAYGQAVAAVVEGSRRAGGPQGAVA